MNLNAPLFAQGTFCEHLRIACTKTFTAEHRDVSGFWDLNKKKVEELLYPLVFVWSPRSEGWPRYDRYEKSIKTAKNCMYWNVALDALPGSARLVRVLDRWSNDCAEPPAIVIYDNCCKLHQHCLNRQPAHFKTHAFLWIDSTGADLSVFKWLFS